MDRSRWLARLAPLAALALVLSGCLKLDMDLELRPDDTVDGAVVFAVDKDLASLADGSLEDLVQEAPLPSDAEGVRVEDYEDEEFVGQRWVFDGIPIGVFVAQDPEGLSIVREGDTFRVSGTLDLAGPTGPTGFDPSAFFSSAEIRIAITFPGEVLSSNGRVEGNTVVWEPRFGERLEIEAVGSAIPSQRGLSTSAIVAIALAGVALLAAVVALVVLRGRRRQAGVDVSPPDDVSPPGDAAMGPGGPPPPARDLPPPPQVPPAP